MVAEHQPGRFAFHDLLRAYAFRQAEIEDSEADRNAAARRCLDHYLHTAHAGAVQINRIRKPLDLAPPAPGAVPEEFSGRGQALAWFDAESPVMLGLFTQAISSGNDEYVWQIAWTLSPFLYRRNRWHEGIGIQRQSLRAAQRLGDPVGLGHAHYELGRMLVNLGNFGEAQPHLAEALEVFSQLGDRPARPPSIRDSARCSSSRAGTPRRWCTRGKRSASSRRSARSRRWPASRTVSAGCTPTSARARRR